MLNTFSEMSYSELKTQWPKTPSSIVMNYDLSLGTMAAVSSVEMFLVLLLGVSINSKQITIIVRIIVHNQGGITILRLLNFKIDIYSYIYSYHIISFFL